MPEPIYTHYKGLGRSFAAAPLTSPVGRHDGPFWDPKCFGDRLATFWDSVVYLLVHWLGVEQPVLTAMLKQTDGTEFMFSQMYGDDSLTVYDYFDTLDFPAPTSNQFVNTGASCAEPKALPRKIELFVNVPESSGTILMAFGTVVNWYRAPDVVRKAWVEALSELKEFRIIWAMQNVEDVKKVINVSLPSHVMVTGWVPQTDILAHKNTILFISHGGIKSLKETICAKIPALFMPLFADQVYNAFLAKKLGFGEYVNKRKVNKSDVEETIRKMTSSKSYYENIKKTKSTWNDRIVPGLDEAAFRVNQVLKYKGVPRKYCVINF